MEGQKPTLCCGRGVAQRQDHSPPTHASIQVGRQVSRASDGGVSGKVQVKVRRARGGKANTIVGKQGLRSVREGASVLLQCEGKK